MPRKKVHKSGIDSTISDAERFPLFETLILAAEPDNDGKTESVKLDGVAIRQYAESTIAKKEAGISNRTLYLFGKAESGEEMTGAEFDELERGMRAQGLDDRAILEQRDTYNSQRLRRRNTEAIMKAGGGALRAPDGSLQIVHPSTKNPGQYQVSRFGKSGVTGDSQFGSIEDAVRFAQGTGHTELVSGEAANDALIQAIEAESSRGAQQTEPRAVSHPDPAINGKNVLTETQDGRVIEAMASHEKPPRGIQRFERPGGEQSQAAQKQPWQMTRAEYYLQENGPIVAAIQGAMRDGRRIELRTQYRITQLRSLDHVRLTSRGEVQIREGKGWVTLFDSQIDNLARQAGMELPPYLDRTFHINYVEEALREGKPVTREVLADYPNLQNQAEDEDELRGQNEERLKAGTLSSHFSDLFTQGRSFSSITEARKVASDFLGKEIKPGTIEAKETDEAIELGIVLAARKIVVENHGNPQATYAALVDLYNRQPNLNVRTSTSVANQAYSTPVPIAYVASRLAGIDEKTTVDEPTAGNGALLIAADPENVHANELDPKRAQALRDQGFSVTTNDATAWTPKGKFDVVIANPPFGVVKNDLGASINYTLLPNFRTTEIDQAIAFKALEAMKNDGRAVLILGGLNKLEKTRQARSDGYNVAAKRRFYYYLYQNYNVVDHFTVAGELYEKQGAGWPVDVIVIDGRGKSSRALPAVDVPRLYESFDRLKDVLDQTPARAVRVGVSAQPGSVSDTGRSGAETRSSELPDTAGRPDRGDGERVGEPERSGDVPSGEPRPSRPTAAEQTRAPGNGNEQSGTARAPQRTEGVSDAGRGGEIRQPGGAEAGEGNQPGAVARAGNERIGRTSGLEGAAGEASGNLYGEEETQPDLFEGLNEQQSGATEPKAESRTIIQATESDGKTAESEAQSQPQPQVTPQSQDTDTHRVYNPASNVRSVDTLVPINMATATGNALARLEQKVGNLDNFVAEKLGYNAEDIPSYFSAEQVDALALAISNIENGAGFIIGDQTGIGKGRSQPLDAKVLTPLGWKRMGDLNVGDLVIAGDGSPTDVTGIYPQGVIDIYRIAFSDGSSTECSTDHLWATWTRNQRHSLKTNPTSVFSLPKVRTTSDLAERLSQIHSIPIVAPVQFEPRPIEIDPYLMGVLLGDGCLREHAIQVVVAEPEMLAGVESSLPDGICAVKVAGREYHYDLKKRSRHWKGMPRSSNSLILGLRSYRLTGKTASNKFVPEEYKVNSAGIRLAILQGLMDTDGYVNQDGACMFYSVSDALASDVVFLVQSLGGVATKGVKQTDKLPCHVVYVKMPNGIKPFRLSRKVDRLKDWEKYHPTRVIRSIEPAGKKAAQCISVAHQSKLYVTDDFIVTHNTVAGMIRYAMQTGKTPIFVTEKPPLYGDMIRDLTDIGMGRIKPLITNANEAVPLDDEALAWAAEAEKAREDGRKAPPQRGRFLETAESKQHTSLLNSVKDLGLKAAGYDAVFTTYNQMQKIRGESAARHDMLERLADGGVVIFDESHNAGGSEPKINKQGEIIEDRARFARKLARKASAVFYSSATYAKRPEVMDLYFKTDLSKAVDDINQLPEVIKKGGIPLQQVVASMLSEAGQYIRRERSFAGVNYDVIAAPVDKEAAETVASVLSSIVDFDVIKQPAVEAIAETIKGAAQALGMDGATNVESANFTALMHNVIDQMLLNLKVAAAANEAIAALKCGEKPVITVANTMGAFLDEYAAENEIRNGDPIKLDFSGVLTRYLERSRRVTIKMPDKTVTHHYLSDDELGPSALSRYNEVKNMIEDGDFSGMAISPIDRIHQKIRDAGYSTAEITGRNQQIDYSGPVAIFRTRPGQETSTIGKKRAINGFNDGSVHALIINQSGSTGISLHASEKFKNQQRRHMIIAQAEKNVDTHMQMLGRVHRTGQVAPPRYTQLAADIPAEKRPAAVLAKKMASLNANTTAARGSAVTAKDVVDFLNEFGDKVAANLMREDQNLWLQLGQPAYEDEEACGVKQDAMRRITGRIPILPIEQQEAVYKRLEDEYRDYIAFLEATGTNTLEAKTLDLQAETRSTDPLTTPKGGDSPFTRASAIEKARVRRLGKPMTSEQVAEMVRKSLGERSGDLDKLQAVGDKRAKELMEQMTGEHAKFAEQRMEGFQLEIDGLREKVDKTEDSQEKTKLQRKLDAVELRLETARADTQKALLTWRALVQTLHPGSQVQLNTEEGSFYGVAVSLERKGEQKNPVALSGWRVNVAVADGARSIQFPLSQVMTEATQESHGGPIIASYADSMPIYNAETETFDRVPVAEAFDKGQSESMETRNIVTGNILAGFEAVKGKGQIVNYTDKDGNVRQGILMPRNWDREKELKQRDIVFKTADQALEFLSANGRLKTRDGDLVLMSNAKGDLMLAANKAKSSGGKYYLNKKIIDAVGKDFVSGGGMMRTSVSKDQARKVIDLLASGEAMGQPTLFLADNMADKAREIVERSKGEGIAVEAGASASIGERLKINGISLEARKHAEDLAEQWVSNENTIQRRGAPTERLMTALQTIANTEAPDPSGRRSLKELSAAVGRIALAALADAGGAEAVQDKEEGAALGKIAGIIASDQQGRLLSLQERIDDAVKIARATIGEIESRMLAQNVTVNAAEMAQSRQPSTHGQGIGW